MSQYETARRLQAKKQHPYTCVFKANVTHQVDKGFFQDEVAEHFRISRSQVSRWTKNGQHVPQIRRFIFW